MLLGNSINLPAIFLKFINYYVADSKIQMLIDPFGCQCKQRIHGNVVTYNVLNNLEVERLSRKSSRSRLLAELIEVIYHFLTTSL